MIAQEQSNLSIGGKKEMALKWTFHQSQDLRGHLINWCISPSNATKNVFLGQGFVVNTLQSIWFSKELIWQQHAHISLSPGLFINDGYKKYFQLIYLNSPCLNTLLLHQFEL